MIQETPQKESTPFYPRSPYAVSKLFAYWITVNYREAYGIYACNGILFNHESPRRGETFITRKITRGLSRIEVGIDNCIYLGNLESKREWGHAKDFVEMQWLMLQQDDPYDYVISTGKNYSVRQFIEKCAAKLGWHDSSGSSILWEGKGLNEIGKRADNGQIIIRIDPRYYRPTEVDTLLGDSSKAREKLGWVPKISMDKMIEEMINNDLIEAKKELFLKEKGFSIFSSKE